jgi:5-methylcytosine-specific restriction enzyme A
MAKWPYSTARWQHVRKRQLSREPLCRACKAEGTDTQAREVDHIRTIASGGAVFDPTNLQSLCTIHHSMKTNYDMQGKDWSTYAKRGCNADGSPRDPNRWPGGDPSLGPDRQGPARATKTELVIKSGN